MGTDRERGEHALYRRLDPPSAPTVPNHPFRTAEPFVLGSYLLVSLLFVRFYFLATQSWSDSDFSAFTHFSDAYKGYDPVFRFRIFMPLVAGGLSHVLRIDLRLLYQALATLLTFGLLIGYREYLKNFLSSGFSGLFSLMIVFPMLWNFCLLSDRYFPFDLPAVLFFVLGCHAIYRRNWFAYYPILALAILNRESAAFLSFVFFFCLRAKMSRKAMLWHLLVQALMWGGLKYSIPVLLGSQSEEMNKLRVQFNGAVLSDMLRFRGHALKDWAKLGLSFGGIWWALPWLIRRQPSFIKRSLLVMIPFLVATVLTGIIDEMRLYSELIPILTTPVAYAIALGLGGSTLRAQRRT